MSTDRRPVGTSRYLETDGERRTIFYNVWLLRFDEDGQCADFTEYWREPPTDGPAQD